jgi:hypothetical protein
MAPDDDGKLTTAEIAALGGEARSRSLTTEEKQAIGRKGAAVRWAGQETKAIKAVRAGTLKLGTAEIPCANLPDGRRVLSEGAIMSALGRGYSGYYSKRDAAAGMPRHRSVSPAVLADFIPAELAGLLARPIAYSPPGTGGVAKGIPAETLPMILDVWIKARDAGVLSPRQRDTAEKAEILSKGLRDVGISALVDEATGFQIDRARNALATILESYVSKKLAKWEQTFDDDFYKEIFRLRGWDASSFQERPGVVGRWTRDIVYERLTPGILERLEKLVGRDSKGRLRFHLHRGLTRDKGYIALKEHLASVTTIMKLTDDRDWLGFYQKLERIHPRIDPQLVLSFLRPVDERIDDPSYVNLPTEPELLSSRSPSASPD